MVVDYEGKLSYLLFLMVYHDFRTLSDKSHNTLLNCNIVFALLFSPFTHVWANANPSPRVVSFTYCVSLDAIKGFNI